MFLELFRLNYSRLAISTKFIESTVARNEHYSSKISLLTFLPGTQLSTHIVPLYLRCCEYVFPGENTAPVHGSEGKTYSQLWSHNKRQQTKKQNIYNFKTKKGLITTPTIQTNLQAKLRCEPVSGSNYSAHSHLR